MDFSHVVERLPQINGSQRMDLSHVAERLPQINGASGGDVQINGDQRC